MNPSPAGLDIILLRPSIPAPPGWEVPNFYLLGRQELTLVDAGYAYPQAADEILAAAGGRPILQILLTHGHLDHAGAAVELRERTGCRIYCHPAEREPLRRRFPKLRVDRELRAGEMVAAEEKKLRVLETFGHSPGHLAFWIEAEGSLFTGDLVTGAGSTFVAPPEGDMIAYMQSLDQVLALPAQRLLPGHGPLISNPQARIRELIFHRRLRELQIGKVLETGPKTLTEMVEKMYGGLIHPGLFGVAGQTLLAHLDKLCLERKVGFRPPDLPPAQRAYFLTVPTPLPY